MSNEDTQQVEPNVDQPDAFDALGDDVFDFEMPDIPMPDEEVKELVVEDKFKSACKFAFLGIGRAGSRLAETFHKVGYGRVCVVNTAQQDLAEINMPEERKLWLGAQGAGGRRKAGAKYVKDYYEDIVDLMRRSFVVISIAPRIAHGERAARHLDKTHRHRDAGRRHRH